MIVLVRDPNIHRTQCKAYEPMIDLPLRSLRRPFNAPKDAHLSSIPVRLHRSLGPRLRLFLTSLTVPK
jgi:hypothetical protein